MKQSSREAHSINATNRITSKQGNWGLKSYGREGKFRSKYEHAFAVYLKELKIKYEFESYGEAITNMTNTQLHYIPDFYLPEFGIYIEIVNHMDKRLGHKITNYNEQKTRLGRPLFVFDKQHLREMFDSKFTIYDIIGFKKKK